MAVDDEILMALCNAWKQRAASLREQGHNHFSPLVMLDNIHTAKAYEECAEELERYAIK